MANDLRNSQILSNTFLARLKNTLAFTMSVNREWSKEWRGTGANKGVTINIRKPPILSGGRGEVAEPEAIQDQLVPLTLNTRYHQAVKLSSQELSLNLTDYGEQVMQPAVDVICNMIDSDGLALAYKTVPHYVGVQGVNPTTNQVYIDAGSRLSDNAVPTGSSRFVVLNPTMQGGILNTQATQFNNQGDISDQNRNGSMGKAWGFKFGMDQNVARHTAGALGTTPLVNVSGGVTEGSTSVVVDGASASVTGYWKEGDIVTFASSRGVNPSSKVAWDRLRPFAVAADASSDGSGNVTLYLTEAIRATGPYQNVTALPADNDAILTFGHASTYAGVGGAQGLAYHKDFITFATCDLYLPPAGIVDGSRASSNDLNLSIRHIRYYEGGPDRVVDRYDVLGGWKVLRPEMACRILGS